MEYGTPLCDLPQRPHHKALWQWAPIRSRGPRPWPCGVLYPVSQTMRGCTKNWAHVLRSHLSLGISESETLTILSCSLEL